MAHEITTVEWHDGWLCVKYSDTDFFKPVRYSHLWPVHKCSRSEAEYLIGREAGYSTPGSYSVRTADYPSGYYIDLPLLNGGQTKSIHTEEQDVPCPKVRKGIETRYRNGQWEKYLKTQGWVQL